MIVSHEHKYIFLKTRKTAGTSLEIALSMQCGRRDLITSVIDEEQIRVEMGGRGKQNYHWPPYRWTRSDLETLRGRHWLPAAYHHMPAAEARQHLSARVWKTYFKFAVTRNPWDAVISQFHWRRSQGDRSTLTEHLWSPHTPLLAQNFDIFAIDGEIVVDKVCRYETLTADLAEIAPRVGLSVESLPRAKSGLRPREPADEDRFNAADRARVAQLFGRDLDAFGYEFPAHLAM